MLDMNLVMIAALEIAAYGISYTLMALNEGFPETGEDTLTLTDDAIADMASDGHGVQLEERPELDSETLLAQAAREAKRHRMATEHDLWADGVRDGKTTRTVTEQMADPVGPWTYEVDYYVYLDPVKMGRLKAGRSDSRDRRGDLDRDNLVAYTVNLGYEGLGGDPEEGKLSSWELDGAHREEEIAEDNKLDSMVVLALNEDLQRERRERMSRLRLWIARAPQGALRKGRRDFWRRVLASRGLAAKTGLWYRAYLLKYQVDEVFGAFAIRGIE